MSQIFYSQVDPNLQQELTRRATAGKTDRSETALRYMTEKIANAQLIAYDGNRRDDNNIVHRLGGKTVLSGEYLPGGDYGFLTTRPYTLQTTSWVANVQNNSVNVESENIKEKLDNTSYRIPPFITGVELAINDNSRGLTNKATINITIPNPERDLDFIESMYARPGRYCALTIAHPDSALMTRDIANINGFLDSGSLPSLELLKTNYPDAAARYDELRKMNQIEFEGLITSFEYQYTQDGSVTMTVYILGTSMVYTDLSMIMQTGTTDETQASGSLVIEQAKTFYQALYDEITFQIGSGLATQRRNDMIAGITSTPQLAPQPINQLTILNTTNNDDKTTNRPGTVLHGVSSLTGYVNIYANLNHVINFLNSRIISKLNGVLLRPAIYCDVFHGIGSNVYSNICSSDPDNIILAGHLSTPNSDLSPDCYGTITRESKTIGKRWFTNIDFFKDQTDNVISTFYPAATESEKIQTIDGDTLEPAGRPGHIFINLKVIETIVNELSGTKDQFTVKAFLERVSAKINSATGGAINLQLVTHPTISSILYFRDTNWIFSPVKAKPQPFLVPMFANDPRGTIVRDFKLSAKLPSNAQSLMYAINSSDKVTEDQVAPYMNFMYNNAAVKRSGTGANTIDAIVYGDKEMTRKLAEQYLETHKKYVEQLKTARIELGADPINTQKQIALAAALKKYIQYPRPTIDQSNQLAAPVFPIDAEFTIDGINGFRYGDIVDFPGIPEKYRRCTTFTIKGITHSVSETGEWTTKITCMMRPKFD
jgi:hypothetical protein